MAQIILTIAHLIGSALPLAVLCFMIALIKDKPKVEDKSIVSYCIVALMMFIVLLRT